MGTALVIGSSDGIGLALTRALAGAGWRVVAASRRATELTGDGVTVAVLDVRADDYRDRLTAVVAESGPIDACVYCAGVGQSLELPELAPERDTFEVNLMGAVATAEVVVPAMLAAGAGHFVGLSSLADRFVNPDAPAYAGSKAGMSMYLESLALACRGHGVYVTNVRFGFVDTKMAKADVRPFMISADEAALRIMRCLETRPIRYTYPRRMAALLWLVSWATRVKIWLS